MNGREYMLPANLGQVKGVADTFLSFAETAVKRGWLSKTFQHNAALLDLDLLHCLTNIVEDIARQNEQVLLKTEGASQGLLFE